MSELGVGIGWHHVQQFIKTNFGKKPDIETVLFLTGIQICGFGPKEFTKEDKEDLIHVAICQSLSYFGYFEETQVTEDGWVDFDQIKPISVLSKEEQNDLIKLGLVRYFSDLGVI